uniref:Small ribosomal subunit protein uS8c n=1 Tax=Euglena hiemalis TaxID=392896 RepID=A0A345UC37_9EUGL|nr:ribosomal protein S8 [Euglena hiemalis]AXI98023.1 ribosomal protein S8 [Euglena hiemalis]
MTNIDLRDMLTRIRNSLLIKADKVNIIRTNINLGIVEILKKEGFIESFEESGKIYLTQEGSVYKYITITLKYKGPKQVPYITKLKRVSKSGLRVYTSYRKIPIIMGGLGLTVMSTSKGLMTNKSSKFTKTGGEILFYIW